MVIVMILGIYCAGGLGREVFDLAVRINLMNNRWSEICFIDNYLETESFYGHKVYKLSEVPYIQGDIEFIIANGEPKIREELYNQILNFGYTLTTLIDPTAIISDTANIGKGVIIFSNSLLASNVKIADNVVIQPLVILGHDIQIGKHSVISSMVSPGGGDIIGERTYIGMGAKIKEKVQIGNDVIISIGSIVHTDIEDGLIAVGNPARVVRRNESKKVFK